MKPTTCQAHVFPGGTGSKCCSVPVAHDFCKKHYARYRAHGSPHVVKKAGRKPGAFVGVDECLVDGCGARYSAKGLCRKHYQSLRTPGSRVWRHHAAWHLEGGGRVYAYGLTPEQADSIRQVLSATEPTDSTQEG